MALHTDRRYEEQLAHLRQLILEMGGLVERQIGDATASLASSDRQVAERTIERDHQVNRYDVDIDEECLRLLALHQPAAKDLRLITTSLKITTDLERVGDMAVNICERAIDLSETPAPLQVDLPRMADTVRKMLRESLDAFVREDADLALSVCKEDDTIDAMHAQMFADLLGRMTRDPSVVSSSLQT